MELKQLIKKIFLFKILANYLTVNLRLIEKINELSINLVWDVVPNTFSIFKISIINKETFNSLEFYVYLLRKGT
jgi:hypothetical protein